MERSSDYASSANVVADPEDREMDDSTQPGQVADQSAPEASPGDGGGVIPAEIAMEEGDSSLGVGTGPFSHTPSETIIEEMDSMIYQLPATTPEEKKVKETAAAALAAASGCSSTRTFPSVNEWSQMGLKRSLAIQLVKKEGERMAEIRERERMTEQVKTPRTTDDLDTDMFFPEEAASRRLAAAAAAETMKDSDAIAASRPVAAAAEIEAMETSGAAVTSEKAEVRVRSVGVAGEPWLETIDIGIWAEPADGRKTRIERAPGWNMELQESVLGTDWIRPKMADAGIQTEMSADTTLRKTESRLHVRREDRAGCKRDIEMGAPWGRMEPFESAEALSYRKKARMDEGKDFNDSAAKEGSMKRTESKDSGVGDVGKGAGKKRIRRNKAWQLKQKARVQTPAGPTSARGGERDRLETGSQSRDGGSEISHRRNERSEEEAAEKKRREEREKMEKRAQRFMMNAPPPAKAPEEPKPASTPTPSTSSTVSADVRPTTSTPKPTKPARKPILFPQADERSKEEKDADRELDSRRGREEMRDAFLATREREMAESRKEKQIEAEKRRKAAAKKEEEEQRRERVNPLTLPPAEYKLYKERRRSVKESSTRRFGGPEVEREEEGKGKGKGKGKSFSMAKDVRGGPCITSNAYDDEDAISSQPRPGRAFYFDEEEFLRREALLSTSAQSAGQKKALQRCEKFRRESEERRQRQVFAEGENIVVNRAPEMVDLTRNEERRPRQEYGPVELNETIGRPEPETRDRRPEPRRVERKMKKRVTMIPFTRLSDKDERERRINLLKKVANGPKIKIILEAASDSDEAREEAPEVEEEEEEEEELPEEAAEWESAEESSEVDQEERCPKRQARRK